MQSRAESMKEKKPSSNEDSIFDFQDIPEAEILSPSGNSSVSIVPEVTSDAEPMDDTEFDKIYKEELDTLSPEFQKILKKIAFQIVEIGLSVEESCIVCNVDPAWFKKLQAERPIIEKIIKKKEIELKKTLLKPIMAGIKSGKDSNRAQWMLENKFSEEYGKKKSGGDGTEDAFGAAIAYIQKNGDASPIVSMKSAIAFVGSGPVNGSKKEKLSKIISDVLK